MSASIHITPRLLRTALKAYNKTPALGQNPLTQLASIEQRIRSDHAAHQPDSITRSKILRELLLKAVETLKPDHAFDSASKDWRGYTILHEQYLGNKAADVVATQLHLEHSAYHQEQARALERLALLLREWEGKAGASVAHPSQREDVPFMALLKPTHKIVGREALLSGLKQQLMMPESTGVSAIHGLPGVGKTTLAIEIANDPDIVARFTDGILWVGLGRQPDVLSLLGLWAKSLGFGDDVISTFKTIEARAQFVHNAIGLRKMLLVADDAWASEAALTFRVGGPNCAHLLTTRFPNIAFDFGVNQTTAVPELSDELSLHLFSGLAPKAAELQPQQMSELVRNVGGLPLAITLMGKYLGQHSAGNSERRLSQAIQRLSKAQARFNLSQPQSPLEHQHDLATTQASLENVIGTSYSFLDAEQQRVLQVLSLFPPKPNTFSEEAAIAVSDASVEMLDALVDAGLVEVVGGRYTLHQTIADFAHERSTSSLSRQNYESFVDFHVTFVEQHEYEFTLIGKEIINLHAALDIAFANGYSSYAKGVTRLCQYLWVCGQISESGNLLKRVTKDMANKCLEEDMAKAHLYLGKAIWQMGDPKEAIDCVKQGLHLSRKIGLEEVISQCLADLGDFARMQGDLSSAQEYLTESLSTAQHCSAKLQQCITLRHLGALEGTRGHYHESLEYLEASLSIANTLSKPDHAVGTLVFLGVTMMEMGNYEKAEIYFDQGLVLARQFKFLGRLCNLLASKSESAIFQNRLGDAEQYAREALDWSRKIHRRGMIAISLGNLGSVAFKRADYQSAILCYEEAISIARLHEDVSTLIDCLSPLGECKLKYHDLSQANSAFDEGLALSKKIDNGKYIATYLYDLSLVAEMRGDQTKAKSLGEESLAIIQKLDFHPRRQEIEDWFSKL